MKTSYFARFDKLVRRGENGIVAGQGISIARSMPRNTTCTKEYIALAPSQKLLNDYKQGKVSWGEYIKEYEIIFAISNPKEWYNYLCNLTEDYGEPILLCWENTKFNLCHRILVANWFEKALGIIINEV
jgi:hypothetical protein